MATSLQFDYLHGLVVDSSNSLSVLTDLEALVKKCEQRLRFFLGEWFLNTSAGIPYFQEIYANSINPALIIGLLNADLLQESDITAVNEIDFTFDRETGKFTYSAKIDSIYGMGTVNTGDI